jgi:hypothetical protein
MKWVKLSLALSLLLFCLAVALPQDIYTDSPTLTPPLPSINPWNPNGTINWQALAEYSELLSQKAQESADSADKLQSWLVDLQKQYDKLLIISQAADQEAKRAIQSREVEVWVWRGGTILGIIGMLVISLNK